MNFMNSIYFKKLINNILLLCFSLVPIVFWMQHFHPFVAMKELVFSASIFISFTLLLASFIIQGRFVIRKTRLSLAVILYYAYNLLCFLIFPYTDRKAFFLFTACILLFFIISSTTDEKARNRILQTLILVALVSSSCGILQFFGTFSIPGGENYFGRVAFGAQEGMRIFSTFGHPNLLGGFCVFIIPIILILGARSLQKKHMLRVAYFITTLILVCITLLLSRTRGSWIGGGIAVLILLIGKGRKYNTAILKNYKRTFIGLILLLCVAVAGVLTIKALTPSLMRSPSVRLRLMYYQDTVRMIKTRPILGHGFNTFNVYYPMFRNNRKAYPLGETLQNYRVEHPHNEHLEILHDGGLLGYGLFMWILIEAFLLLTKQNNFITFGLSASLVGLLCDGFFSQNLRYIVISSLLWLLLGLANLEVNQHISFPLPPVFRLTGGVLGVALLLYSLAFAYNAMQAEYYVGQGMGLLEAEHHEAAIKPFEQALRLDPAHKAAAYYLAAAYKSSNRPAKAFKLYKRLADQDPNFLKLNSQLAALHLERKEVMRARECFERQIAVNNMDWQSYYNLAIIENSLDNSKKAITYLQEIEKIHAIQRLKFEKYIHVKKTLAQLYINTADWEQALKVLRQLKKAAPQETWVDSVIEQVKVRMKNSVFNRTILHKQEPVSILVREM